MMKQELKGEGEMDVLVAALNEGPAPKPERLCCVATKLPPLTPEEAAMPLPWRKDVTRGQYRAMTPDQKVLLDVLPLTFPPDHIYIADQMERLQREAEHRHWQRVLWRFEKWTHGRGALCRLRDRNTLTKVAKLRSMARKALRAASAIHV